MQPYMSTYGDISSLPGYGQGGYSVGTYPMGGQNAQAGLHTMVAPPIPTQPVYNQPFVPAAQGSDVLTDPQDLTNTNTEGETR